MESSKDYLDFIMEQQSELDKITYRPMIGEDIIYYQGKLLVEFMMTGYFCGDILKLTIIQGV